jgi:hypothetical protein
MLILGRDELGPGLDGCASMQSRKSGIGGKVKQAVNSTGKSARNGMATAYPSSRSSMSPGGSKLLVVFICAKNLDDLDHLSVRKQATESGVSKLGDGGERESLTRRMKGKGVPDQYYHGHGRMAPS